MKTEKLQKNFEKIFLKTKKHKKKLKMLKKIKKFKKRAIR